jgi:CopG family nickel-responsive transcriptional regulator
LERTNDKDHTHGCYIPAKTSQGIDEISAKTGYKSRSKAIQDAASLFVSDKKWLRDEEADQTGLLLMVYDHEVKGLQSGLTEVQHDHASIVSSTMHIHVGKRDCLENIAV